MSISVSFRVLQNELIDVLKQMQRAEKSAKKIEYTGGYNN
jgi:hypothetical protein